MKTLVLMRARAAGLEAWLLRDLALRPWLADAPQLAVYLPAPDGPALYDAVIEVRAGPGAAAAALADADLAARAQVWAGACEELIGKGEARWPAAAGMAAGPVPGVALLSFLRPLPGMERAAFLGHWRAHVALARAVHWGMNRYGQNRMAEPLGEGEEEGWLGMAHLHFPDAHSLRHGLFRTEADKALIAADVAGFVGAHQTMEARWHILRNASA
ncbi:MAG TPA: EthD family reductase [Novosphingobium sp.]|nr:EthD family reductase [Novosphingobium sp.]HZV11301.1 EthD family reductase [Novosphingobium sp.]